MSGAVCEVFDLGGMPYTAAWRLQEELAGEISLGRCPPALLLVEHPHTFTFGRRGQAEHLLWDAAECQRRGVTVHWVDRGGDVTYHGPGQLVGYPLLPLGAPLQASGELPRADYTGYLRRLEETLLRALAEMGLCAMRMPGMTGVWVSEPGLAKIAAIGVKVDSRGVSRHGFALNVDTDLAYWQGIVACGLAGYSVANLSALLSPAPSMAQVKASVLGAFGAVFDFTLQAAHLENEKNFAPSSV